MKSTGLFKRKNKKRELYRKKLKFSLLVGGCALLLVGATVSIPALLPRFSWLRVKEIKVEGALSPEQGEKLIRQSDIQIGTALFSLDLEKSVKKLEENNWLDEVKIMRRLTGKVVLKVKIRQPKFLVLLNELHYLDEKGKLFRTVSEKEDPKDFPVLTGLVQSELEQDPDKASKIFEEAILLLRYYSNSPLYSEWGISEIHYSAAEGFTIFPESKKIRIICGEGSFESKIKRLEQAWSQLQRMGQSFASLDLNYEGKVILKL